MSTTWSLVPAELRNGSGRGRRHCLQQHNVVWLRESHPLGGAAGCWWGGLDLGRGLRRWEKRGCFFYPAYLPSLGGHGEGCALGAEDGSEPGRSPEPEHCSVLPCSWEEREAGKWGSGLQGSCLCDQETVTALENRGGSPSVMAMSRKHAGAVKNRRKGRLDRESWNCVCSSDRTVRGTGVFPAAISVKTSKNHRAVGSRVLLC